MKTKPAHKRNHARDRIVSLKEFATIAVRGFPDVVMRLPFVTQLSERNTIQIMLDLLNGPLSVANVQAFLTQAEPVISSALANNPFPTTDGSPGDESNRLCAWVAAHDVNVRPQLAAPSPRPWPDRQFDSTLNITRQH